MMLTIIISSASTNQMNMVVDRTLECKIKRIVGVLWDLQVAIEKMRIVMEEGLMIEVHCPHRDIVTTLGTHEMTIGLNTTGVTLEVTLEVTTETIIEEIIGVIIEVTSGAIIETITEAT